MAVTVSGPSGAAVSASAVAMTHAGNKTINDSETIISRFMRTLLAWNQRTA